jgi:hypothetical protein
MDTVKTEERTCRCGTVFTTEIKRGRPKVWCDSCRDEINSGARNRMRVEEERAKPPEEREMTPGERIDYLELLLKSRGTHISQHSTDRF